MSDVGSTRCLLHFIIHSTNRVAGLIRWPRHDGFWFTCGTGRQNGVARETVVCVTGDGSIQMNIQELSTALQYELPVLVVNLNNRYLGMVKQWQGI